MVGKSFPKRIGSAPEAVATVVYSRRSLEDLERAIGFLVAESPMAAIDAVQAVRSAIEHLAPHPLLGRRVEGEIRELVISYGKTGYLALYRFVAPADEIRVLTIRHQREIGYRP